MSDLMSDERLAEIRLDAESYANHQRYGEHELPYRTIERLECDDFPKYVDELLSHITALNAERDALKAEVEKLMNYTLALEMSVRDMLDYEHVTGGQESHARELLEWATHNVHAKTDKLRYAMPRRKLAL